MKYALVFMLAVATSSCLAQSKAERIRPAIRGMENVEVEIHDHFSNLIDDGFESIANGDSLDITENGDEKIIVMEVDGELQVYFLVADGEMYNTALQFAVENSVDTPDGEHVELLTTVIESNASLLRRSERTAGLQRSIKEGASLSVIASEQVEIQENMSRLSATETSNSRTSSAGAVAVSCSGTSSAICCGFSGGNGVRVICVCNQGSNRWVLCFDSDWK